MLLQIFKNSRKKTNSKDRKQEAANYFGSDFKRMQSQNSNQMAQCDLAHWSKLIFFFYFRFLSSLEISHCAKAVTKNECT